MRKILLKRKRYRKPIRTFLILFFILLNLPVLSLAGNVRAERVKKNNSEVIMSDLTFNYDQRLFSDEDVINYLEKNDIRDKEFTYDGANYKLSHLLFILRDQYSISPTVSVTMLELMFNLVSEKPELTDKDINEFTTLMIELSTDFYQHLYGDNKKDNSNSASYALREIFSKQSKIKNKLSKFTEKYSELFGEIVSTDELIQTQELRTLSTTNFMIPWKYGETWTMTSGPHNISGRESDGRPYSAIDVQPSGFTGCTPNIITNRWAAAAAGGTTSLEWSTNSYFLKIDHGNGLQTVYGHLANNIGPGHSVNTGDLLGNPSCLGGTATGVHIHFGVKQNNQWVDIAGTKLSGWEVLEYGWRSGAFYKNGVTTTTLTSDNDGYSVPLGNNNHIFAINRMDAGSNSTAVHILNRDSNFQDFILQTGTALPQLGSANDWVLLEGDYNGDGYSDIFAISKDDVGSNSTAIHVLDGSTNYQSFLTQTGTPLGRKGTDNRWKYAVGDHNNDGWLDVYAINRQDIGSNSTAVHILNGATNFQTFLTRTGTVLGQTGTNFGWEFTVGDYNNDNHPDLYAIAKNDPGSNSAAIYILDGNYNFQRFLRIAGSALPQLGFANDFSFQTGDYNEDGKIDLYAIAKEDLGSNSTAVHILDRNSNYYSFLLQTGTVLHRTGTDFTWQFGV